MGDDEQESEVAERLVEETDSFSFAYVKELFVSSMVRWMVGPRERSIAPILFEQLAVLKQQMHSDASRPPEPPIDASSSDEE